MIYLFAAVWSVCLLLGAKKPDEVSDRPWYKVIISWESVCKFLAALPVFLVSALRYGIGTDYFVTYAPMFQRAVQGLSTDYYEIGFRVLNLIVAKLTDNYQWLFVVTSFLFVFWVYRAIYQQSDYYIASVAIFFLSYNYFISMNNVRQSLASALALFALKYLKEEEYVKYVLVVILAATFHQSAIVYLVFVLVRKIHVSAHMALGVSLAGVLVRTWIGPLVLQQLAKIPRLQMYIRTGLYAGRTTSRLQLLFNILFLVIAFWVEIVEYKKEEWNFDLNMAKMTQIIVIGCFALDGFVPAMYRIVRLFTFYQIIELPNCVELIEKKNNKYMIYSAVFLMFLVFFFQLYLSGSEDVFPYRSIWSDSWVE